MGRHRKNLTLEEILDFVLPMLKDKGLAVPSFRSWAQATIEDIKRNPFYKREEGKTWGNKDGEG